MIVAVNKMDLMDYSEVVFREIQQDFISFAGKLKIADIRFIPTLEIH